jgi:hypothetical protein
MNVHLDDGYDNSDRPYPQVLPLAPKARQQVGPQRAEDVQPIGDLKPFYRDDTDIYKYGLEIRDTYARVIWNAQVPPFASELKT